MDGVLLSVLAASFTVLTGLITGLIMLLFTSHSKRIEAVEKNYVPRHEHNISLEATREVLQMIQGMIRDIDVRLISMQKRDYERDL